MSNPFPANNQASHNLENPDEEGWEVECILDSRKRYSKLLYLVQWASYNYVNTGWEPAEDLESASELVAKVLRLENGTVTYNVALH